MEIYQDVMSGTELKLSSYVKVAVILIGLFDNIEPLKPWGFLLGDTMPSLIQIKPIIQILKK